MKPYDGPAVDTCRAILPLLQAGSQATDDPIRYWAGVVLYITGCMGGDVGFHNAATLLRLAAKSADETGEVVEALSEDFDADVLDDDAARMH